MAGPLQWISEQTRYLLFGPGSNTPTSTQLVSIPPALPETRTSLIFDSHIQEAANTRTKNPQTISAAWDDQRQWSNDSSRTWQGLTAQDRKTIMLDIYLNNPWISACIDVIAKRICSGGFTVEKVDEEQADNQAHLDTLNDFLLRINPDWDFLQLARSLITAELIFGESYAELTWRAGQPWQLFPVDCINMGYEANRYGQIERFYQQMDSNTQKNWLDPQNIIRWWFPHPRASIDPFAPSEKITDAVLIDKKMMVWMTTFFQKGAKFPFYFEGLADQDEADRFLTFFRQNFTGEKNAHVPPVTWGNAKISPLGNQGGMDMDFQKGLDRMRTIVFAAFGVPPAAVSIIESGNIGSGTGEDQDKSLIFNACDPVKQAFLEKLNFRITKGGFGITDYRIGLRYADYRSDEAVSKVEDTRIKNGSRTVDEIRLESGKKPYKKGGSVPFIWSTKEVVPLARLDDLEDEQRQSAQVTLDTAKANADMAQTKAKQAKEPPEPVQPPAMQPGHPLQKGQQNVAPKATDEKKQEEAVQLELLADEVWDKMIASQETHYFTGKTELPQWIDPDEDEMLAKLAQQGVVALTWESGPNPCRLCLMNDKVTVKLGMPFPSGHRTPLLHPHCDCELKQIKGPVQEEDKDATQKLPAVKVRKPNA